MVRWGEEGEGYSGEGFCLTVHYVNWEDPIRVGGWDALGVRTRSVLVMCGNRLWGCGEQRSRCSIQYSVIMILVNIRHAIETTRIDITGLRRKRALHRRRFYLSFS